jgi:hypothetical protein
MKSSYREWPQAKLFAEGRLISELHEPVNYAQPLLLCAQSQPPRRFSRLPESGHDNEGQLWPKWVVSCLSVNRCVGAEADIRHSTTLAGKLLVQERLRSCTVRLQRAA